MLDFNLIICRNRVQHLGAQVQNTDLYPSKKASLKYCYLQYKELLISGGNYLMLKTEMRFYSNKLRSTPNWCNFFIICKIFLHVSYFELKNMQLSSGFILSSWEWKIHKLKLTGRDLKFLPLSYLHGRCLTHVHNMVYKDDSNVYEE